MTISIDNASYRRLRLPLRTFRTARGSFEDRSTVLVRLECIVDGRRVVGRGEAAPLEAWGTESIEHVGAILDDLPVPTGEFELPALDDRLPALRDRPATRCAVETAMLDAIGRARGLSVSTLLHDTDDALRHVPVNGVLGAEPDGETIRQLVGDGFECLKMKLATDDLDGAVRRVQQVRRQLPSRVALRIDANGTWERATAGAFLERLRGDAVAYVEQPVADAPGALVDLASVSPVPVAADESAHPVDRALDLASRGLPVLVLKPSALGGLRRARRLAREMADLRTRIVWTSALESAVGRAALLHLAADCGDGPHGLATGHLVRDDTSRDLGQPADGHLPVPDGPGLGISVDRTALRRLTDADGVAGGPS